MNDTSPKPSAALARTRTRPGADTVADTVTGFYEPTALETGRRRLLLTAAAVPLALFALSNTQPAHAAKDPIYTSLFSNKAAGGYDVVAYFTEGKARKGVDDFSTEYQGAKWLFATQAHLDAFLAEPERYAPQYGGYCAYAVAQGATAKGDPEQWSVHDGKLYLNYDASIRQTWEGNRDAFIETADKLWPTVLD